MSDILKKILAVKQTEVAAAIGVTSLEAMEQQAKAMPQPRDFLGAIQRQVGVDEANAKSETTMQQGGRAKDALFAVACGSTPLIAS